MTQRLIRQGPVKPAFSILIVPWLNMVTKKMPSERDYTWLPVFGMNLQYVGGYANVTNEMKNIFETNEHLLIFNDNDLAKYQSLLDVNSIPENNWIVTNDGALAEYKANGRNSLQTSVKSLSDSGILMRDQKFRDAVLTLFSDDVSPSFVDDATLVQYPATYMLVCDRDPLRYEDLIFGERMQRLNVSVELGFFNCNHGKGFFNSAEERNPGLWSFMSKQFA
jgi:acetyl esterase/lipase